MQILVAILDEESGKTWQIVLDETVREEIAFIGTGLVCSFKYGADEEESLGVAPVEASTRERFLQSAGVILDSHREYMEKVCGG